MEVRIGVRDPQDPDARRCLRAYQTELASRFDDGFDPTLSISATDEEMTPPAGLFLVATVDGEPAGCGALKFHGDAPPGGCQGPRGGCSLYPRQPCSRQ